MKQTIIPAGYRVTIASWENDADNYKDKIHEGLSKERVEYILELCNLFKSGSNNGGKTFGNMNEYSRNARDNLAKAEQAVMTVLEKHRAVLDECELANLEGPEDEMEVCEIVNEFIGSSEDYIFRVYDGAKVEYIPHEIRMEDVTSQFEV
jgi:hypothetical protein